MDSREAAERARLAETFLFPVSYTHLVNALTAATLSIQSRL